MLVLKQRGVRLLRFHITILGRITERLGEDIFPWRNMIMSPECPQHLPVIELMREAAEKLGQIDAIGQSLDSVH